MSNTGEQQGYQEALIDLRHVLGMDMDINPSAKRVYLAKIDRLLALSQPDIRPNSDAVRALLDNPMAAGAYRVGVIDTLNAYGIHIPGINSTEDHRGETSE